MLALRVQKVLASLGGLSVLGTLAAGVASAQPGQIFRVQAQDRAIAIAVGQQEADVPLAEEAAANPMGEESDLGPIETTEQAAPQIGPKEIRLQLLDGSVISGELSVDHVVMTTDFGSLTVPINRIVSMRPGLNSYPELRTKLDTLVADLAAETFEQREQAQKELISYGLKISRYLETVGDDGDSERQTRLETVRKALEEELLAAEMDGNVETGWIEGDTIVTDQFTVVGKIESTEFNLTNRYGQLVVALGDIEEGIRQTGSRPTVARRMKINASNFVQRQWASSGIRVERGDRITLRSTGNMSLVPWGEQSTPEGVAHCGTYMGVHPVGAVIAKIGEGQLIAVGADETFVASQSGTLHLAISMMDNFANQGYDWTGGYEVKVRVEPQ